MNTTTSAKGSVGFDRALETVERLALEEQEALVDVVSHRIAAARRAVLVREVAAARRDHRQGKVRRGTAADLMAELRRA